MDAERSLAQWARTVQFPQPLRWGDVEAAILSRPPPEVEPPIRTGRGVLGGPGAPLVLLAGTLLYGASLIGLAILLASQSGAIDATEPWVLVTHLAFIVAACASLATIFIWLDTGRRRSWKDLVLTAGTGVASLVAFLLLGRAPEDYRTTWLSILTLGAAALGLLAFALIAFGSRAWRRRTSRAERPTSREDAQYNIARAQVLESLVKRGVVQGEDIDIPDMLDMPIGSWHELDEPQG